MATVPAPVATPTTSRIDRAGFAWALFECGRIPYVVMLSVVFMPYFAKTVVGNTVEGQADVATFAKYAGFAAACTAPLLGAMLDQWGPRKPWIAAFMAILVAIVASLWFAEPRGAGLPAGAIIVLLILGKLFYTYTEAMHNSLLAVAAAETPPARLSGLSIMLGALSGFVFLLAILLTVVLPAQAHPGEPVLGLDTDTSQHLRLVPVLSALLLIAATLPLLWFARDYPATSKSWATVFRGAFTYLRGLAAHLRAKPNAAKFLLARMVYADGLTAISIFTGVLAAGVMNWTPAELLMMGIGQLAASALGAWLLAKLDLRIGSKRALQIMLSGMIVLLIAIVGTGPDRLLFIHLPVPSPILWNGDAFHTWADAIFLALILAMTGLTSGTTASSRALLAALSPASEAGAFFGLYAMAGTVTAWLAPLAIGWATRASGSQQAGFVPVIVLIAIGLTLLSGVRPAPSPEKS